MKHKTLYISMLAIIFSFVIVSIILFLLGKNPIMFFVTLLTVLANDSNGTILRSFFMYVVPLTFVALGVSFAFRTGLFNIGVEGQFGMGLLAGVFIGSIEGIPAPLHLLLVIIGGFVFGSLWALLPALFRAYFAVHEVVMSIMMNYIALYLLKGLFLPYFSNPTKPHQAISIERTATMQNVFNEAELLRVPLNYWLFGVIMLVGVVAYHLMINKTTFGFELRTGGFNEDAAQYAGMNSKRNIMLSLLIAGGFAGIGGAFYVLNGTTIATGGFEHTGYGFNGLAAALLGGSTVIGSLMGSSFLAYLTVISVSMQQSLGIPKEITDIIIALILFFIASAYAFEWLMKKKRKDV